MSHSKKNILFIKRPEKYEYIHSKVVIIHSLALRIVIQIRISSVMNSTFELFNSIYLQLPESITFRAFDQVFKPRIINFIKENKITWYMLILQSRYVLRPELSLFE